MTVRSPSPHAPLSKRAFDLVFAIALLPVLGVAMLIVAIAVRIFLGSPVLFRQTRAGMHGAPFELFKFRTMTDARDASGQLLDDAQRLTPFGVWLRKTSLDELPQLLNVFRGDISFVGPRPLLMDYLPLYSAEQARRHLTLPGITGWAQVNGRNAISWDQKFQLDVWYVDHRSMLLDLRILLMTLGRLVRTTDVSQPGQATMERFTGRVEPGACDSMGEKEHGDADRPTNAPG